MIREWLPLQLVSTRKYPTRISTQNYGTSLILKIFHLWRKKAEVGVESISTMQHLGVLTWTSLFSCCSFCCPSHFRCACRLQQWHGRSQKKSKEAFFSKQTKPCVWTILSRRQRVIWNCIIQARVMLLVFPNTCSAGTTYGASQLLCVPFPLCSLILPNVF